MRTRLVGICAYGLGIITLLVATQSGVLAGRTVSAPEIDGASISAGLGVLAAGILILRSRLRTK
jgi:hypothetical protein